MGGSRPGERRGGRQKGTPNKVTADVKAAIIEAFQGAGGSRYLATVAKKQPAVFCRLLGLVVPLQMKADITGKVTLEQLVADSLPKPKS